MNLYKWDVVCTASCQAINEKLITYFHDDYGVFDYSDAEGNGIIGKIGSLAIVNGGHGQRINIRVELLSGMLTTKGTKFDISGFSTLLQVEMEFIVEDEEYRQFSDTLLRFNFSQVKNSDDHIVVGEGSVVFNKQMKNLTSHDNLHVQKLDELIAYMIVAYREKFNFVIARIFNPFFFDNDEFNVIQYSYSDMNSVSPGVLAVMCIYKSNSYPANPDDLSLDFDLSLIKENGFLGFAFSKRSFMHKFVLPVMPYLFYYSRDKHFKINENAGIVNSSVIPLHTIENHTPTIIDLSLDLINGLIVIKAKGICEVLPGISYVTFEIEGTARCDYSVIQGDPTYAAITLDFNLQRNVIVHNERTCYWLNNGSTLASYVDKIGAELQLAILGDNSPQVFMPYFPVAFNTILNPNTGFNYKSYFFDDGLYFQD